MVDFVLLELGQSKADSLVDDHYSELLEQGETQQGSDVPGEDIEILVSGKGAQDRVDESHEKKWQGDGDGQ